jgi:hypothetical protein
MGELAPLLRARSNLTRPRSTVSKPLRGSADAVSRLMRPGLSMRRGCKEDAKRLALEVRAGIGLGLVDRLNPRALADECGVRIYTVNGLASACDPPSATGSAAPDRPGVGAPPAAAARWRHPQPQGAAAPHNGPDHRRPVRAAVRRLGGQEALSAAAAGARPDPLQPARDRPPTHPLPAPASSRTGPRRPDRRPRSNAGGPRSKAFSSSESPTPAPRATTG